MDVSAIVSEMSGVGDRPDCAWSHGQVVSAVHWTSQAWSPQMLNAIEIFLRGLWCRLSRKHGMTLTRRSCSSAKWLGSHTTSSSHLQT